MTQEGQKRTAAINNNNNNDSTFVMHTSCDACGSSDANGVFDDGHTFCFSCNTYTEGEEPSRPANDNGSKPVQNKDQAQQKNLLKGQAKAIPGRGITEAIAKKFGYLVGMYNGQEVHIATYRDRHGKPISQKLRTKDKQFMTVGNHKEAAIFGSHLWSSGKMLVLTEGELDCLAASVINGGRFPVASISHGAAAAVNCVKRNWDWINGFDSVVIAFDMDQVGQQAALAVAEALPVGKAKIAYLPAKDANACLIEGKSKEFTDAIFQAKPFRPDGIKSASDYRGVISIDETASAISWPYSLLNEMLLGMRKRELICLAAGSGTGKTTFTKEIAHHLMQSGQKVGLISLEEHPKRTLLGLVGVHLNKNLLIDRSQATDEEVLEGFDDLFRDDPCVLYDSFGTNDIDVICQRIEYMSRALDVDWVILDHVSILVSGAEGDERRMLDQAATAFRTMVQAENLGMIMVSHLTRPGGRGHESGAAVELSQLRGSHALAQLSDSCIGIQKDPDDPDSDIRLLRVLKNRFSGQIGDAGTLHYNRETGRLLEAAVASFDEEPSEKQTEEESDNAQ